MLEDPVVIVSYGRTPLGSFQGALGSISAPTLGATAIKHCLAQVHLDHGAVDEVILGCVLAAGIGQAPARQAALGSGLSESTPCTTINKMCGSGMKAVMLAHDSLLANPQQTLIAGGMESMSNAPYLLPKARSGYRVGHQQVIDHMFLDGLEDAYEKGRLMGTFADATAREFSFTREQQDDFALASLSRANNAIAKGWFKNEIAPVEVTLKQQTQVVVEDEGPSRARPEKIPQLAPAFNKDGTVTAANSSSISDGAASLLLMRRSQAERKGLTPIATLRGHSTYAQAPAWFTTAPGFAIARLLEQCQWTVAEVDLFEINEAFAVVTMAAMKQINIPHEKVNIHGGACALGHPIGASGARILVTLINALQQHGLKRGVAALCIGGGEATAMAIEME